MKFNALVEVKINELETFATVSMIGAIIALILIASWDTIASAFCLQHSNGIGWQQMVVMGLLGLYAFWAYTIRRNWAE